MKRESRRRIERGDARCADEVFSSGGLSGERSGGGAGRSPIRFEYPDDVLSSMVTRAPGVRYARRSAVLVVFPPMVQTCAQNRF